MVRFRMTRRRWFAALLLSLAGGGGCLLWERWTLNPLERRLCGEWLRTGDQVQQPTLMRLSPDRRFSMESVGETPRRIGMRGTWTCREDSLRIETDESWSQFALRLPDRLRNHFHKANSLRWQVAWESDDRIRLILGDPALRGPEITWVRHQHPAGPGWPSGDGLREERPAGMND